MLRDSTDADVGLRLLASWTVPLQPVLRRSVPDAVFDQVLDEVVSGALGPGASLPSERRLAEVLGVSRPAVREAPPSTGTV